MGRNPAEPTDLDMMKDAFDWPGWPVLPIVNRKKLDERKWPRSGVIFDLDDQSKKFTVFEVNVWDLRGGLVSDIVNSIPLEKQHKYESFEAMIADGWEVD